MLVNEGIKHGLWGFRVAKNKADSYKVEIRKANRREIMQPQIVCQRLAAYLSAANVFIQPQPFSMNLTESLRASIREVPDFPINGISFKDISPIFLRPELIAATSSALSAPWRGRGITKIMGIDSRGFLFGPQMAVDLECGFVMVRKKGKLPPETISVSYQLEYGEAAIESVADAVVAGDRVLVHDDLLATGGTALAAARLAQKLGAEVVGFSFLVSLSFLNGHEKLHTVSPHIHAIIDFES